MGAAAKVKRLAGVGARGDGEPNDRGLIAAAIRCRGFADRYTITGNQLNIADLLSKREVLPFAISKNREGVSAMAA